jgi:hypothetical protein
MVRGYGRWLAWLDSRGLLDEQVIPGDRITSDRVRAYVGHLEAENSSGTVIARLIELKVTAAIMDPGADWSWIYRMASSIRARHKPARPKRHRLVHIGRLFDLGLDLMAGAQNETTTLSRFKAYRDGLMIGLLASRPLRLRIESASQKLGQAQKETEEYLVSISDVIARAHSEFAAGLKNVLADGYREFYERLSNATSLLRQAIEELASTVGA